MLHLFLSILGILLTIFFVIGTHEYAHFLAARLLNVKVLRFSIGFGKTLIRWHDKQGTEYVFALIPLGGYVKMLDEREGEVAPEDRRYAFNRQSFLKKFIIVLAGPVMNIFCALMLYWLIFVIGFNTVRPIIGSVTPNSIAARSGLPAKQEIIAVDGDNTHTWTGIMFRMIAHLGNQDQMTLTTQDAQQHRSTYTLNLTHWTIDALTPDPLSSLGITPYTPEIPLVIGVIAPNSPALSSPLKVGDKILSINAKPMKTWEEVIQYINKHPGQSLSFRIERHGVTQTIAVTLGTKSPWFGQKTGYLGISPQFEWPAQLIHKIQYAPLAALPHAWHEMMDLTYFNLLLFGKMITGKLSLQSLGGPITIFESAGDALNSGLLAFISFLAFLSISIGVINLLPIPGLDGGHLFIFAVEAVLRRPLPEQVVFNMYRAGFLLLIFILVQAMINDLLRL